MCVCVCELASFVSKNRSPKHFRPFLYQIWSVALVILFNWRIFFYIYFSKQKRNFWFIIFSFIFPFSDCSMSWLKGGWGFGGRFKQFIKRSFVKNEIKRREMKNAVWGCANIFHNSLYANIKSVWCFEGTTVTLPMNVRLENTTLARFNVTSGLNYAHHRPSIGIQRQRQISFIGWTDTDNNVSVHL